MSFHSLRRAPQRALLLGVGVLALAVDVHAQQADPQPSEFDRRQIERVLAGRSRDTLHPSDDPLLIVGREQGDNDLRSGTPALQRSDRRVLTEDAEVARARRLAMYEEGATYTSPLPSEEPQPRPEGTRMRRFAAPEASEEMEFGVGFWVVCAVLGALGVAWAIKCLPEAQPRRLQPASHSPAVSHGHAAQHAAAHSSAAAGHGPSPTPPQA